MLVKASARPKMSPGTWSRRKQRAQTRLLSAPLLDSSHWDQGQCHPTFLQPLSMWLHPCQIHQQQVIHRLGQELCMKWRTSLDGFWCPTTFLVE